MNFRSVLTPVVLTSAVSVIASGTALAFIAPAQAWKALVAGLFIALAGAITGWSHARHKKAGAGQRSLKRIRAIFIVACLMVSSQLAYALARAAEWFDGDSGRWTIQWLFVALTAAAIEVLSSSSEKSKYDNRKD